MSEVEAQTAMGSLDLEALDHLPVTAATIQDGRLRTYVLALLAELGFHGHSVRIDLGSTDPESNVGTIPVLISIQTRSAIHRVMEYLVAYGSGEARGIRCPEFGDFRSRLKAEEPKLQEIHPKNILELLEAGTILKLPEGLRIIRDPDAFTHISQHLADYAGQSETFALPTCVEYYCSSAPFSGVDVAQEIRAGDELHPLNSAFKEHRNRALYLFGAGRGRVTLFWFPNHVDFLPLTAQAVAERQVAHEVFADYSRSGDTLEAGRDDAEHSDVAMEEALADALGDDPGIKILIGSSVRRCDMTTYDSAEDTVTDDYNINGRDAFDRLRDLFVRWTRGKMQFRLLERLEEGAIMLVHVRGRSLACYAVPPEDVHEFQCY